MNKNTIRRADIYYAELMGGENIIKGIHPVLIVSCKKFNSSTTLINVVPITSTIKNNAINIPIGKESGLLHDSELQCGQIQTINQKDLKKKIGFANQEIMDQVIRTLVKQFSGKYSELDLVKKEKLEFMINSIKKLISFKIKYNITDIEIDAQIEQLISEVESYCKSSNIEYNNWFNIELFKVFQEKRREIRIASIKKDGALAAKLSKEYLEYLHELAYEECRGDICSEFEWAYYNNALHLKKLGYVNESYDFAKQALLFSSNEDANRILAYWLIGECCSLKCIEFEEEGLDAFNKCIEFYTKVGEKKYEILSQFNKAKLLKNINDMQKYMDEYANTQIKNVIYNFGDMQLDEVLLELEKEINDIKSLSL